MNFPEAISSGFGKYAQPKGRASRSEYWYWSLFTLIVTTVAGTIDGMLGTNALKLIVNLALFLPSFAVGARRLHDIDRTYWWLLLVFTVIGVVVLVYWHILRGTSGPNRFGPDPLRRWGPGEADLDRGSSVSRVD
jgi:uncharacterized membrane protein YhaH (DUF805 family)